jgi:hypothetical protein
MTADQNREAVIERDVVRTQDEIGDTVEKLEEKLNPRNVADAFIGEDGMDTAKEAFEVARRNPLPVGLIAIGAVWLFATSDAPMIRELRNRLTGKSGGSGRGRSGLRPRSTEPAPIGPPPIKGGEFDRRREESAR